MLEQGMSRLTTGALSDKFYELREQKRAHEEAIKQIGNQMSLIETQLMEQMDAEGITKATGRKATVSISETIKPNVTDWDQFYEYIRKNKYFHLLERRPSVSGCNELFETKGKIPGVVPFTKRGVNMRAL
jgi:hypothetical protein